MSIEGRSDAKQGGRIRLGMVGGGQGAFIGAVHRLAARMDDHYEFVAGALSSSPERSKASGEELGLAADRIYGDYRDMAKAESKRRDGIEAVAIVTPNNVHVPAAKAFVETPKPPPVSYGTIPYFGINAFKFTNAKGTATHVRYQLQPAAGAHYLSKVQISTMGPDYLTDEIRERVRRGPVKFKLLAQLADPGDTIDNPTIVWPDSRKTVELGTIAITKAVADSQDAEKKLLFVPGALLSGIEAADPMIAARSAAYIVSLSRRAQGK